jgi:hypothetical protein
MILIISSLLVIKSGKLNNLKQKCWNIAPDM